MKILYLLFFNKGHSVKYVFLVHSSVKRVIQKQLVCVITIKITEIFPVSK